MSDKKYSDGHRYYLQKSLWSCANKQENEETGRTPQKEKPKDREREP